MGEFNQAAHLAMVGLAFLSGQADPVSIGSS